MKNLNKNFRYIIKTGINDLILLTKIVGVSYWEEEDPKKYIFGIVSPKYGPLFGPIWNKFGKICISRFLFPKVQISQYPYGVNDVLMGHIW